MALAIPDLIDDWVISLRAKNLSPRTIKMYAEVVGDLARWLEAEGRPVDVAQIRRRDAEAYLGAVLGRSSPGNAAKHYRCLRQFFRWLEAEEGLPSPMAGMRPPRVPLQPPPIVSDGELRRLLKVCEGPTFENRRDRAIIAVLADTGLRASELMGLRLTDVNLTEQTLTVTGKGARRRTVPVGARAAEALARYLRARRSHKDADSPWLWLGARGPLTYWGLTQLLRRRCRDAGIGEINPHRFRHTLAHAWLAAGGQEQDLLQIAGWATPQMLARYGASAAAARAREAHRRLSPLDRLLDR